MRLLVSNLACVRGGREIFSDLSFAIGEGEAMVTLGRNGAGKSSLLRMVAGFLHVAAGTIVLEGADRELSIAEQAHYLGHQDAWKPALTVTENLEFWARYFGSIAAPGPALAAVGLDMVADLPAAYLSAGQRRRLSIARLLAVKRPIWLLDEPTSTLDSAAQAGLAAFMREHLFAGGIILAATHAEIGIEGAKELRLDQRPAAHAAEGRGGAQE